MCYPQPVHKSSHDMRYPLKLGKTILKGRVRARGENAIGSDLTRFRVLYTCTVFVILARYLQGIAIGKNYWGDRNIFLADLQKTHIIFYMDRRQQSLTWPKRASSLNLVGDSSPYDCSQTRCTVSSDGVSKPNGAVLILWCSYRLPESLVLGNQTGWERVNTGEPRQRASGGHH